MADGFPELLSLLEIRIITEFIYGLRQGFPNCFKFWNVLQILTKEVIRCGRKLRNIWKLPDTDCRLGIVIVIFVHVFFLLCLPDRVLP